MTPSGPSRTMRGWWLAALVALVLAPTAGAATCKMNNYGQTFEFPCGPDEEPAKDASGAWYESGAFQVGLAVLGFAGSGAAGFFTYRRVQRRKRALTGHLAALERAYGEAKANPGEGVQRLVALSGAVHADHARGRLDDGQFLELDKRAKDYVVRLRLLEIDMRFRHLPPALLGQLRHLVGDGTVSQAEADLIEHHAAAYGVAEPARTDLVRLAREWAREDVAQPPAAPPANEVRVPVEAPPAPAARPPLRIFAKK